MKDNAEIECTYLFRDITLYSLFKVILYFGRTSVKEIARRMDYNCWFTYVCFTYSSTLKEEAETSPETYINIQRKVLFYIPLDMTFIANVCRASVPV
jgi:hypothetical protein